jgi:hypothetical protein
MPHNSLEARYLQAARPQVKNNNHNKNQRKRIA